MNWAGRKALVHLSLGDFPAGARLDVVASRRAFLLSKAQALKILAGRVIVVRDGNGLHPPCCQLDRHAHVGGGFRDRAVQKNLEFIVSIVQLQRKQIGLVLKFLRDKLGVEIHKDPIKTSVEKTVPYFMAAD